jgi:uncharacterized protein YdeI (YjbR/CyaY-like superfamily)
MAKRDPRIDAYIAKSADFATPILEHLRGVVHVACPEVEETVKWGSPHFDYKGEMMCAMAAFKQHCAFGFWKGTLVMGKSSSEKGESAGWLGRITRVADLPSKKVLTGYIKKAMALNDAGIKAPRMKRPAKQALPVPADLSRALKANKAARESFDGFSPSARRDYIEWMQEAKTDDTRARRLATAVGWIAEGKRRNWKYEK